MENTVTFGGKRDGRDFRGDLGVKMVSGRHSGLFSGPCFQGQKAIVRGVARSRKFLGTVLSCISFIKRFPGTSNTQHA
jgi:hypothetical protein